MRGGIRIRIRIRILGVVNDGCCGIHIRQGLFDRQSVFGAARWQLPGIGGVVQFPAGTDAHVSKVWFEPARGRLGTPVSPQSRVGLGNGEDREVREGSPSTDMFSVHAGEIGTEDEDDESSATSSAVLRTALVEDGGKFCDRDNSKMVDRVSPETVGKLLP